MSMNYVVRKKVDKSGDKEVVRYYAASKVLQPEPVSNDELVRGWLLSAPCRWAMPSPCWCNCRIL